MRNFTKASGVLHVPSRTTCGAVVVAANAANGSSRERCTRRIGVVGMTRRTCAAAMVALAVPTAMVRQMRHLSASSDRLPVLVQLSSGWFSCDSVSDRKTVCVEYACDRPVCGVWDRTDCRDSGVREETDAQTDGRGPCRSSIRRRGSGSVCGAGRCGRCCRTSILDAGLMAGCCVDGAVRNRGRKSCCETSVEHREGPEIVL